MRTNRKHHQSCLGVCNRHRNTVAHFQADNMKAKTHITEPERALHPVFGPLWGTEATQGESPAGAQRAGRGQTVFVMSRTTAAVEA